MAIDTMATNSWAVAQFGAQAGEVARRVVQALADAQQVGTIDVDHVQRERNLGDPLRFRHELIGEHGRSHDIEDMNPLERHRALASEPSRGQRVLDGFRGRARSVLAYRLEQAVSVGKMAIERGPGHAGGRREICRRNRGRCLEQPATRLDDLAPRPLRAGSRGHCGESTRSCGDLQAPTAPLRPSPLDATAVRANRASRAPARTGGADRAISPVHAGPHQSARRRLASFVANGTTAPSARGAGPLGAAVARPNRGLSADDARTGFVREAITAWCTGADRSRSRRPARAAARAR